MKTQKSSLKCQLWQSALASLLIFSISDAQTASGAPSTPTPRTDANSLKAHEELVQKAKQGRIDLYFLGDSITRRWGTSDAKWKANLENWNQNFFGWNAGNFGWGADKTQNILWRIIHGELDGVNPKVIVLLAGTNNLPDSDSPEQIAQGIKVITQECQKRAPNAKIILTGILPRNDQMTLLPKIERTNSFLNKIADGKKVIYLDIARGIADEKGKLYEGMTIDGLHLSVKGYQVWADALTPILTRVLGQRKTVDLAPPPTGDPSAKPPGNYADLRLASLDCKSSKSE